MAQQKARPSRPSLAALAFYSLLSTATATIPLTFCSDDNTATGPLNEEYQFMSASRCHDNCLASGTNAAFAVVSFQDCWCTEYAPANQLDADLCQPICPGWKYELCGGGGYFGYVALGTQPAGTIGASSSTPQASSTPDPSTTPQPPNTTTETQLDTSTVMQTTTNLVVSTRTATPQVSFVVITQAGRVSTLYVTPTAASSASPSFAVQPSSQQDFPVAHASGLSNGAVAGITIGAIAGAVLLGLLFFFCCWRKRRGARDQEGGIKRNTSVLSKVGLLRSGSQKPALSRQPPRIQTSGLPFGSGAGPASAGTLASDSQMSESRRSRPLFVDQRLNPNALFAQSNTSRTSVGTLQDNQDYSRPLEVRNPDL